MGVCLVGGVFGDGMLLASIAMGAMFTFVIEVPLYREGDRPKERFKAMKDFHLGTDGKRSCRQKQELELQIMKWKDETTYDAGVRMRDAGISRRRVMGSSGLAIAGLLSGAALSGPAGEPERAQRNAGQGRRRAGQFRDYSERMRNANAEERMQIMREFSVRRYEEALENLKGRLGISDTEWQVIKPRLQAVYDRVRSRGRSMGGSQQAGTQVENRRRELRELLREREMEADQIKAKLTALRAAQEKARQELARARQDLCRLLTLRQEAKLVLDGLLV